MKPEPKGSGYLGVKAWVPGRNGLEYSGAKTLVEW